MDRSPVSEMPEWEPYVQAQFRGRPLDLDPREVVVPDVTPWLPTHQAMLTAIVHRSPARSFDVVVAVCRGANEHHVRVYEDERGGGVARVVVGSGIWRMNRTLVQIGAHPSPDGATEIEMRAAAKEGLIKQRSSEKALRRFRDELSKALGVPVADEPVSQPPGESG